MAGSSSELSRRVEAVLRAVLPDSVDLTVDESMSSSRTDEFRVQIRGKPFRVVWASNAWLTTAEEILSRSERPDLLVSERVSPGSREALAEAGIGWVETSGAAHIETDFLVVSRTGDRQRPDRTRPGWTPTVLGVAEAILLGVEPTVSSTHESTGLSVGSCTKALRLLTDLGVLEAQAPRGPRSGRRLSDPDALLDAYVAAAHDLQPSLKVGVGVAWQDPVQGLVEIGRRWNEEDVPWVATGLVAASVVAPLVTSVGTAEVYVSGGTIPELELVASTVGLRPIEGGRLVLAPFPTETTRRMSTVADGLRVAPWPRLVADLRRSGVRGEEAAEHLKETVGGG